MAERNWLLYCMTSDSGAFTNDQNTKVTTPVFTGKAEAGSTVRLLDGATQVGSATPRTVSRFTHDARAIGEGVVEALFRAATAYVLPENAA